MTVRVRTANPQALSDTLAALPGGIHTVQVHTYDEGIVEVESSNEGFLVFACKNQGYGVVVES